jgi:Endonuclease IV
MGESKFLLGSHLPLTAPGFYLETCQKAAAFGENTFMFYTGAPQNTRRAPLSQLRIAEGRAFLKENGFDESKIVVNAPYIINLANVADPRVRSLALSFLGEEIRRVDGFGFRFWSCIPVRP